MELFPKGFLVQFLYLCENEMNKTMAYSDFTFEDLETKHGLGYNIRPFFSQIKPIQPSDFLLQQLALAEHFPLRNEENEVRIFNCSCAFIH
jgi:hypothetical protein